MRRLKEGNDWELENLKELIEGNNVYIEYETRESNIEGYCSATIRGKWLTFKGKQITLDFSIKNLDLQGAFDFNDGDTVIRFKNSSNILHAKL